MKMSNNDNVLKTDKEILDAIIKGNFNKASELENTLLTYPDKNLRKVNRHDPDLINAVRFCINFGLTYDESIEQIKKFGLKIEKKTFQRIKLELKKDKIARFEQISKTTPLIQDSMGMVDASMASLFEIVKNSKDNWQKIKAIKIILDCIILQGKLFKDSNPWSV